LAETAKTLALPQIRLQACLHYRVSLLPAQVRRLRFTPAST